MVSSGEKSRMLLNMLTGQPLAVKNYLAQDVDSAEVEKLRAIVLNFCSI